MGLLCRYCTPLPRGRPGAHRRAGGSNVPVPVHIHVPSLPHHPHHHRRWLARRIFVPVPAHVGSVFRPACCAIGRHIYNMSVVGWRCPFATSDSGRLELAWDFHLSRHGQFRIPDHAVLKKKRDVSDLGSPGIFKQATLECGIIAFLL